MKRKDQRRERNAGVSILGHNSWGQFCKRLTGSLGSSRYFGLPSLSHTVAWLLSITDSAALRSSWVESELSTRQAKHWMEGLSQKEWTLVTQCLILVLADRTKCPSRLLGQGDNQMNLIQPPRATVNIETFSRNYLDELGRLAADGWLQLKKEETWISTILGAFSFFTPSDFVSQLSR